MINRTLNRLEYLGTLYREGYQSDVVDKTLEKILLLEERTAQQELTKLQQRLQAFENQYHFSSDEFYRKFQLGEMGDDMDFMEWSIFYEMADSVRKRLNTLKDKLS